MNQPASKDPSMDEILSSIRQIIADDEPPADEPAAAPEMLATEITADDEPESLTAMVEEPKQAAKAAPPAPAKSVSPPEEDEEVPLALGAEQMLNPPNTKAGMPDLPDDDGDEAPLALSADQMLNPPKAEPKSAPADDLVRAAPSPEEFVAEFGDDVSEDVAMVVPDDIAFINDDDSEEESVAMDLDDLTTDVDLASLDDAVPAQEPEPEEEIPASPLPDPTLTTQISEELLEPATQAAASSAFSQLDALTLSGGNGQTVEDLIREMLRPMLKGWLDENLPGVVEKLVQREIERVSRGNR
ncbi:DUF2497 domain-containing protein [Maritalea porphyrae]|uniref:DUF2497 domain-containing protein n=1 Tax=Maritalea porphyrae TaxID=880732 RepID=UPI0022B02FB1|nr:DUF2497 domain-containing protein [Maritalea porphyrae]MCZ4273168.1 DUF2497 domain-containing protein [Maritalea porphyrae]